MEKPSVHVLKPMALKRKRNRETKSCWPCRDRKVKCDMSLPCSTCIRRHHTNLCQYGPRPASTETTRASISSPSRRSKDEINRFIIYVPNASAAYSPSESVHGDDQSPSTDVTPQESTHHDLPERLIPLLNNIAYNLTESWETDKVTKNTTFLGRNSPATFFRRLSVVHIYDLLPPDISVESAFCLTNRTTLHPFGSLWVTVNVTLGDILQALPELETCMRYYRSYQQTVKPFYPFLIEPEAFERRFCEFLQNLEEAGLEGVSSSRLSESTFNDAAWYGLLFAVLASGCQYSDTEPKERVLRTRVFGRSEGELHRLRSSIWSSTNIAVVVCAFECLRLANLYVLPSIEVIQCMLFLEMTLANDCNPGVANGLLGITVQQAQELGLHVRRKQQSGDSSPRDEVHPLWRAIVFLDSVLSSAYDRKPLTFLPTGYNILHDPSHSTASSFHEIMWAIHALKVNWQKTSAEDPAAVKHLNAIEPYINALGQIEEAADKMFAAAKTSASIQGKLEELVYTMYLSCFKSKLARSACLSKCPSLSQRRTFFEHMNAGLREVVRAFLALKRLSPIAVVSWDIVSRAMTAALLLAGIETVMSIRESQALLEKLTQSLESTADGKESGSEAAMMIVAPFKHAVDTLRYLLDKQTHVQVQ